MIYHVHQPLFPLNAFIESFVYYKGYNPIHTVDRFLPDGNIHLIVDLTDYPKFIYDNDTLKEIQACKDVWFSGIRNTFITIPSGKDSEMFIINFRKGKAAPFLQMPVYEFTDQVVDGELALSKNINQLREILLPGTSPAQKCTDASRFLLKHYGNHLHSNACVDYAVNQICRSPQQTTMAALSAKIGYSQKHLIQLFREQVGLTPKAFLKIMRFQKAIHDIEQAQHINWATIAAESGYYDQAHFISDFKLFSGFTPGNYLHQQSEFTNYIAVG